MLTPRAIPAVERFFEQGILQAAQGDTLGGVERQDRDEVAAPARPGPRPARAARRLGIGADQPRRDARQQRMGEQQQVGEAVVPAPAERPGDAQFGGARLHGGDHAQFGVALDLHLMHIMPHRRFAGGRRRKRQARRGRGCRNRRARLPVPGRGPARGPARRRRRPRGRGGGSQGQAGSAASGPAATTQVTRACGGPPGTASRRSAVSIGVFVFLLAGRGGGRMPNLPHAAL